MKSILLTLFLICLNISVLSAQCDSLFCTGRNSFFGVNAGLLNTGNNNSLFGYNAGSVDSLGSSNSFFGSEVGLVNTGSGNSFFGTNAGHSNTIGGSNCYFGVNSASFNSTGFGNAFFGNEAGVFNTGTGNSFYGFKAGSNLNGNFNICLGNTSGPPSPGLNASNRLYIDVTDTVDPLIYGEFDNNFVRVNGTFEATAVGNNSDVNCKEDITNVDPQWVLNKLVGLRISEWEFKDAPDGRHIGPMAQDFFDAFGLGQSNTTITTLDADGVAFAAIQALKKENEDLKEENNRLADMIINLDSRLKHLENSR